MKHLIIITSLLLASGCAINQNVEPVNEGTSIEKIYIQENEKVHMKELINELVSQVDSLGFSAQAYTGEKPVDAKHHMLYTANWQWDVAMYLTYFRASLYEGNLLIGEVEYDSTMGGMNMSKFGRTADKIAPLLEQLLANVPRPEIASSEP